MKIVIAGLPGKIASAVANGISFDALHSSAISSKQNAGKSWTHKSSAKVDLVTASHLGETLKQGSEYVGLDFSPCVEEHAAIWNELGIPVVIGASNFDLAAVRERIMTLNGLAVLGTNLASPMVALQAILRFAATEFPGAFDGFSWRCTESHQQGKKDVSGTARALLPSFQALGFSNANVEHVTSIRDPEQQRTLGVAEEFLAGHGWHRYEGERDGMTIALEHRTNGRAMYAAGALKACGFALAKWKAGVRGEIFDMVDVLRDKP